MKILLASSEVHPYSKTGGLADMVAALAKALVRAGHRVGVVTPLYLGIRERLTELKRLEEPALDLPLGVRTVRGELWSLETIPGLTIYFVDQPDFYQRDGLYQKDGIDYPDNAERFLFLAKTVAHMALTLDWTPELVHLNDWQVALAALSLLHQRQAGAASVPRTCLTIHNLAYQGVFPASQYVLTNLPWDYFVPAKVEFYGQFNCFKAGLCCADALTAVSPRYAREITTPEFGCGLDGLLRERQATLFGILNGVDYEEWNTTHNPYLKHPYSAEDPSGKTVNKAELQAECGLPVDPGIPLFGSIGRMVEQKGIDIMLAALQEMLNSKIQFIQLGSGSPALQRAFQELSRRFPGRASVRIGFDEGLSHRIEAGCDFFLMPSRFEPCGLNQLYSMRYATIPIVRATGGLDDTVVDPREDLGCATGIKFHEYSGRALAKAIRKALALYETPELLQQFRLNAMAADFSWTRIAAQYIEIYQRALEAPKAKQNS